MSKTLPLLLLLPLLLVFVSCQSDDAEDSGNRLTLQYSAQSSAQNPGGASAASRNDGGEMAPGMGSFPNANLLRPTPAVGNFMPVPFAAMSPNPLPYPTGDEVLRGSADGWPLSLAQLSMGVDSVPGAATQVQAIATSLGGFVERLSGVAGGNEPWYEVVVKVPQGDFAVALARIEALGDVQFRSLGSEDVTDRHVDLTARLTAYQREERTLASLLERSGSVAEALSVERELARVRTNVERTQWQLELLERQIDLATIQVTLVRRASAAPTGPVARLEVQASNVADRVSELREFLGRRLGAIDEIYLAASDSGERAEVTFRVYSEDFDLAIVLLEGQGRVISRELVDRRGTGSEATQRPRRPDARITVSYRHEPSGVGAWTVILIIVGILALAAAGTYLVREAYNRGRRRGSFI